MSKKIITMTIAGIMIFSSAILNAQTAFSNDNLSLLIANDDKSNSSISVIEIDKNTANQTAIQTIDLPTTGEDALKTSGTATTTLYASNSADGSLLCFSAVMTDITTTVNVVRTKAAVSINNSGSVNIAASYVANANGHTRGATTIDNTSFYITDEKGLFTNDATAPSPTGAFRASKAFGSNAYSSLASSDANSPQVGTLSAITGGSYNPLPGLDNNLQFRDFYLIASDKATNVFDILYILRTAEIEKYSLVDDEWVSNGIYNGLGGFGLAVESTDGGAFLYVSTGTGAIKNNSVIKLNDKAGYNSSIDIDTDDNKTLITLSNDGIIKGVAFAPKDLSLSSSIVKNQERNWILKDRTLNFQELSKTNIKVYSITGSLIAEYKPAYQIELGLTQGVYIIQVNNTSSKMIIK